MPGNGKYFSYMPAIPYSTLDGGVNYKVVTDIFKRVRATLEAKTDKTIYYKYRVLEGQKPEHVAYNYYDNANYHWTILLMNEIRDPQWCWPMNQSTFERYLIKKYGSVITAQNQTHHYETNEIKASSADDNYDVDDVILQAGIYVDSNFTYSYTPFNNGVPSTKQEFASVVAVREVSALEYEIAENNKRSDIILLRRNLIQEFVDSFDNLVTVRR